MPIGQLIPFGPRPQYPFGCLLSERYCWWVYAATGQSLGDQRRGPGGGAAPVRTGQVRYRAENGLITTRGRRSGTLRRTALIFGRDGDRYALVASNGDAAKHPRWYLNLVADPEVTVQVGAETFAGRARTAKAEEKPPLWDLMVS